MQRDALLTRQISKQEEKKLEEVEQAAKRDRERAKEEKEHQAEYLRARDDLAKTHLEQWAKDKKELDLLKVEELRLQRARTRALARTREAEQCNLGMAAMLEQKNDLYAHLKKRVEEKKKAESLAQAIQSPVVEGEDEAESTVEVMMETRDEEMDMTIIEMGKLWEANGQAEQLVYERLQSLEQSSIQFKFEVLSYLDSIVRVYWQARETRGKERLIQEVYPRMWTYLSLRNLLMRHEVERGEEDPNTQIAARFAAADRAYQVWKGQRARVRKPSQSPSSSKS